MNYMAKVAEMLGVEIGEEFEVNGFLGIRHHLSPYKFNNDSLLDRNGFSCSVELKELLRGEYTIKRKPWQPKTRETYFTPDVSERDLYNQADWHDDKLDNLWFERRLIFRTKEEAITASQKMLKALEETQ